MVRIFKSSKEAYTALPSPYAHYGILTTQGLWNQAGAKQLSFDLRKLPPGKYSFPFHYHHAAEELFLIISGSGALRHAEGSCRIEAGDIVFFPYGPQGAHQVYNDGDQPLEYLDIRAIGLLDAITYPDTHKTGILPDMIMFDRQHQPGYWEGEEDPARFWIEGQTGNED